MYIDYNTLNRITTYFNRMEIIIEKTVTNTKEPMLPEIVLFGLIFVSFFPLKNLPKTNPPISERMQHKRQKKIKIFNPKLRVKI